MWIVILCLSAILHLIFLIQFQDTPYGAMLMVDAEVYHAKALAILKNGWLSEISFYQAPFYPYLLAVIYRLTGVNPFHVQIFQSILSVANVFIVFLIGKKLFSRRVGIVAAAIACLYGPWIYFAGLLIKESLTVFFADAMLLALLCANTAPRTWKYLVAGFFGGICVSLRENMYLILPVIFIWILWYAPSIKQKFAYALTLLLGVAAIVAPFAVKNFYYTKDLRLTGYHAGLNFYIGNNPEATGFFTRLDFFRPGPAYEETDVRSKTEQILKKRLTPSEISQYWFRHTLEGFGDNPFLFPKLLGLKLALFLNNYEIPDNYDFSFMRSIISVLRLTFVNYGLVMILALFGIFLSRSRDPAFQLLYSYMFMSVLSVIVFYVNARYRFPIVPSLIVFAAYAAVDGWKKIIFTKPTLRQAQGERLTQDERGNNKIFSGARIFIAAAVFLALSFGILNPYADIKQGFAVSWLKIGNSYENRGRLEEAVQYYEKALALWPDNVRTLHQLGIVAERQGHVGQALERYREAIVTQPCFIDALYSTAFVFQKQGLDEQAIDNFESALECNPDRPETHNNLGLLYEKTGRTNEAIREYHRAIEIWPYYADAHNNLGVLYSEHGAKTFAEAEFAEALKIDPNHIGALRNSKVIHGSTRLPTPERGDGGQAGSP